MPECTHDTRDTAAQAPAAQSSAGLRATNIAVPLTPLIGRDEEVERVRAMLHRPSVRLLTLLGPGGVGKTRLALHLAATSENSFPDGAWLVELAPVRDTAMVAQAIATALGLRMDTTGSVLDALQEAIGTRRVLLVLDNFEHVLEARSLVVSLLTACPNLTVLVTSRAPLSVRAEMVATVSPLPVPELDGLLDQPNLMASPSVKLFIERAQAVRPDFAVTDATARTIGEICARLDGLPLALELAAVRIKALTPDALLHRLRARLDLLTQAPHDLPPRHRTMRDAIAWSYDLLSPGEQALFRLCSVFVDRFTLEAVEAVSRSCTEHRAPRTEAILDHLTALIDHSLVRPISDDVHQVRYAMLETIREFGQESSTACRDEERLRAAHADYYLALVCQSQAALLGVGQRRVIRELDIDRPNLHAALAWLLEQGRNDEAAQFALALWRFWDVRGYFAEARLWFERLMERAETLQDPDRAMIAAYLGNIARRRGQYDEADRLLTESLRLHRAIDDPSGIATSLNECGLLKHARGDFDQAHALHTEAETIARQVGDERNLAFALEALGNIAQAQNDQETSRARFEEALAIYEALQDPLLVGALQARLGLLVSRSNDLARARQLVEESLITFRAVGDRREISNVLRVLALFDIKEGHRRDAAIKLSEALTILEGLNFRYGIILAIEDISLLAYLTSRRSDAAFIQGVAYRDREAVGLPLAARDPEPFGRELAALRTSGEAGIEAAWRAGYDSSLAQGRAVARTVLEDALAPSERDLNLPPHNLSERELDVLRLVAEGLTSAQIADRLYLSRNTIHTHLRRIYAKLGVSSRSAATRFALDHGLVVRWDAPD